MSLELIREAIKVNQLVGEDSAQTVVESDIIVPDVKPDIARILLLDGDIYVNSTEVMQEKVHASGVICYKILYISDDANQCVKSINTNANFSYSLDVFNASPGMQCKVRCEIEHMEYDILNGRKINIKTIIKINGKVSEEIEQNIINNLKDLDDVQILKDSIKVNCFLGEATDSYSIREAMEVPAGKPTIREILRNDIKITGKDYKVTDNKVVAKGDLNISTLYIGDDENQNIQYMEYEIPFAQFIDLPGINENATCDVEYLVTDSQFTPDEDSDGELRFINGEINLSIKVEGFCKRSIEVISDAYSPNVRLNLEKEPFKTEEVVSENKGQIILKDTIILQEGSPDIEEVFNVLCKPCLTEYKIFDDKVVMEGLVNNNVLYLANSSEQPVSCFQQEVPFKHSVDIKGIKPEMVCDIGLDIEHCNYSMVSSNEVEIRLVIGLNMKVINKVVIPLIVKVVESPLEDKKVEAGPSIIVYFAKQGDSLWKIAKKYYTTIDSIETINNLTDHDVISPGQQVIIPRRIF